MVLFAPQAYFLHKWSEKLCKALLLGLFRRGKTGKNHTFPIHETLQMQHLRALPRAQPCKPPPHGGDRFFVVKLLHKGRPQFIRDTAADQESQALFNAVQQSCRKAAAPGFRETVS